ncbi:extracellular solute-binding protein [uncultured Subdoligranulum sp.]|uniref:ABC transporter substrate-binding protein n=1 Tax=uncultured Subdoligranulum sp. TaxID=512298 RepID=UPI0025E3B59F|nr:extracellular solute-binding protein [uncultured Subdoligranulum sp.]
MKKQLSLLLAAGMTASLLAGCGGGASSTASESTASESTASSAAATGEAASGSDLSADITMWTYPIGQFGDAETVNSIISKFQETHPGINVTVEYLDYTNGDDQVTAAIEAGTTPDIVMEGPERLVSNWGAKGKMLDLSDLWTDEATADISAVSESVVSACKGADGNYYEYPLCMTTHTMAINKEMFEEAGALQYINEDGTWTTENFEKALQALKDNGVDTTMIVYCGGQGGDQGTRALVNNLYSGQFTNADHTAYTTDSEQNKKALQQLLDWSNEGLISYDAAAQASDELQLFANGTIAMTLCWNASNQAQYASSVSFTPMAVAFPSDDGVPELCGGIWGFGIFNNGDDTKAAAAKEFIKFLCDDPTQGPESVRLTGFFPVRSSFGDVYTGTEDEERMAQFSSFMQYLGDYYPVTGGWAEQRTAWWNMLQQIFTGTSVDEAVATYTTTSNDALAAAAA